MFSSDMRKALVVLGNGNASRGRVLLLAITTRLAEARLKHPDWQDKGLYWALGVIGNEYHELEHAVLEESEQRQLDEALDVIVTAIRFVNSEMSSEKPQNEHYRSRQKTLEKELNAHERGAQAC